MTRQHHSIGLTALLVALVACQDPTTATPSASAPSLARSANAPVHQASGGGKLDVSLFGAYEPEQYGFTAIVDGNGVAKGRMHANFSSPDVTFEADVKCLSVNGSDAWIGIRITHTHDASVYANGTEMVVRVRDNGEGAGAPPDEMSFFYQRPAASCVAQADLGALFPWLHGNVQVR